MTNTRAYHAPRTAVVERSLHAKPGGYHLQTSHDVCNMPGAESGVGQQARR